MMTMTFDQKVSKESFGYYRRWMKFIRDAEPKMPERHDVDTLKLYCLTKSLEGTNGLACYAGDDVLAKQLHWNRDTVAKYKKLAVELGWFIWEGERKGRAKKLNVAIPDDAGDSYRPAVSQPHSGSQRQPEPTEPKPGECSCWQCREGRTQLCVMGDWEREQAELEAERELRERERAEAKVRATVDMSASDPWAE
jgi:hypothetical protein